MVCVFVLGGWGWIHSQLISVVSLFLFQPTKRATWFLPFSLRWFSFKNVFISGWIQPVVFFLKHIVCTHTKEVTVNSKHSRNWKSRAVLGIILSSSEADVSAPLKTASLLRWLAYERPLVLERSFLMISFTATEKTTEGERNLFQCIHTTFSSAEKYIQRNVCSAQFFFWAADYKMPTSSRAGLFAEEVMVSMRKVTLWFCYLSLMQLHTKNVYVGSEDKSNKQEKFYRNNLLHINYPHSSKHHM